MQHSPLAFVPTAAADDMLLLGGVHGLWGCSAQSLLTTASKNAHGSYDYNVATVPLLSEMLKLVASGAHRSRPLCSSGCRLRQGHSMYDAISQCPPSEGRPMVHTAFMLYREFSENPDKLKITTNWKSVMLFPVPSVIYLAHHSITFPMLALVDPATYQILGNLKIVTTGLASKFLLGRRMSQVRSPALSALPSRVCLCATPACRLSSLPVLSALQLKWISLMLLTFGTTTSQLSSGKGDTLFAAPVMGYVLGVVNALLSGAFHFQPLFPLDRSHTHHTLAESRPISQRTRVEGGLALPSHPYPLPTSPRPPFQRHCGRRSVVQAS